MQVRRTIEDKLQRAFSPDFLVVTDNSHLHAGHAGARPEGETHFLVEIDAPALRAKNRVAAQRDIYSVLGEELAGPVHALELKVRR